MSFTGILEFSGAAHVSLLTPTAKPYSVHVTVTHKPARESIE